jgi:ABC-type multidrug transport system ATPase subunit
MKALCGQLNVGSAHLDGDILYNGDPVTSGKYLVHKVAGYVDEKDQHLGTLTVRETLDFAFMMSCGGHHSYGVADSPEAAAQLDKHDEKKLKVFRVFCCLLVLIRAAIRSFQMR